MRRIARVATLAIFIGAAATQAVAQGGGAGQRPVQQRPEPATQTKQREPQIAASPQVTPNCSGRPGARCAKKGGAKKLRTIF